MQRIEIRVFLRLPDALRMQGRKSAWAFGKGNDHLHSFLEKPAFDGAGDLYLVDIPYGRILGPPPQSGAFTHAQRADGHNVVVYRNRSARWADAMLYYVESLRRLGAAAPIHSQKVS